MGDKSGASSQAVSLPVAGAGLRGLGETFQPDLNSGTGNYSVPLELLPGVANFQPILTLVYSTGAGNGAWGLGWSLPLAVITRRTFRGVPAYDDATDAFLHGGSELVEVEPGGYRARVENGFERFVRTGAGWEVTLKSGVRHTFGAASESRIEFAAEGEEPRVLSWLLERSEDTAGNSITYHYRGEGSQRYLEEIRYALYRIRFTYEPRPDPITDFRAGFELLMTLRCARISLHAQPVGTEAVRSWQFEYEQVPLSELSLLSRLTMVGHDPETSATAVAPTLEFGYTGFDARRRRIQRFASERGAQPPGLADSDAELIDLEGRGLPGVLSVKHGTPRYWSNAGRTSWNAPRTLTRFPAAFSLRDERVRLADMDGDGAADLLVAGRPLSGYYRNAGSGDWGEFVPYERSPSFDLDADQLNLVDVDGDGLIDAVQTGRHGWHVYANHGPAGWEPPRLVPQSDSTEAPPDVSAANPRVRLADMNGDGLLDVVLLSSGRVEYWPSRGNGRHAAGRVMFDAPRFPHPFDPARALVTDINGDGLADVVYVGYDEVLYWINQSGDRFSAPQTIRHTPPTSHPDALRIVDMNGAGTAGLLWTEPFTDYRYLDFTGGVKPGLLERIDNHLGRVITISYGSSTEQALADAAEGQPWQSFLPFPLQIVTSTAIDDGVSGLHSMTHYRYHQGHYDGVRREFDGFGRSEQIEVGDESMPSTRTVFHFHTEASARVLIADPELRRTLKRKLYRVEVYGPDGSAVEDRPYRIEETRWDTKVELVTTDGRQVVFPHIAETSITILERSTEPRIERRAFTYDGVGNVLVEERRGEGEGGAPLFLRTEVEYALGGEPRAVDRPARIIQRDDAGILLNETRHYYDGLDFHGLPLGECTQGLLTRTERVVFSQSEAASLYGSNAPDFMALGYHAGLDVDGQSVWLVNHERRQMDAQGNTVAMRDALGHITRYDFDDFHLFATRITDSQGFVGRVDYDYRVGKPRRLVNPNGGISQARYDPLGRLTQAALPGDSIDLPTAAYAYETSVVPAVRRIAHRLITGHEAVAETLEYLDGGGSIHQRRTEHDGDIFIVSGHLLTNARGKTSQKLEPFFAAGSDFEPYIDDPAAPRRRISYDALGRPTATFNPDGRESRAVYGSWETRFTDMGHTDSSSPATLGAPRIEHYDAWQRLIAVTEHDAEAASTTHYQLDPLGRLRQITDARGIVLSRIIYDRLGRRVAIQHLDAGRRLIAYDARDKVVLTVNGAGETIERSYDALGRISQTIYDGAVQEEYSYDQGAGTNLAGRLARVIDPSGETTFGYDLQGNVLERSKTVPDGSTPFMFRYAYDRIGRLTTLTYPDEIVVQLEYYSGSALRRVVGYVDEIEYTAAGMQSSIHYANGVRTDYRYDPATLRLSEIETWHPSTEQVYFHAAYSIDRAGNVRHISDLAPGPPNPSRNQHFDYDARGQLVHADGFDGNGAYAHSYTYDVVGNLRQNPLLSGHPLAYAGDGTNQPIGVNDGNETIRLFEHDANGNVVNMPGRRLSFNPKQELVRARLEDDSEVRFFYDYRGLLTRRERIDQDGRNVTHYFEDLYEVRGGTTIRRVFAGKLPVASEQDGTRSFLHNDHLGSTVVHTDVDGTRIAQTSYYPFGAVAFSTALAAEPLFTTKRFEAEIGLYYFNARWYAPDLGRFVSPDPLYVFEPEQGIQEPRRLNPYAYAGNNPLTFVDPDGLFFGALIGLIASLINAAVVAAAAVVAPTVWGGAMVLGGLGLGGTLAAAGVGAVIGGATLQSGEGVFRGIFVTISAATNWSVAPLLLGPVGQVVGAVGGVIGFLANFPAVSQSDTYQGFAGWSSYLMPMSWPGHAHGLVLWTLNVLGSVFTFFQVDALRIRDMIVDWPTGNIATAGGWIGTVAPTAFNQGAFSVFNPGNPAMYDPNLPRRERFLTLAHESGHMLNNAAFGWIHTSTSIISTWATFSRPAVYRETYWERYAEGNVPGAADPRFNLWGE